MHEYAIYSIYKTIIDEGSTHYGTSAVYSIFDLQAPVSVPMVTHNSFYLHHMLSYNLFKIPHELLKIIWQRAIDAAFK